MTGYLRAGSASVGPRLFARGLEPLLGWGAVDMLHALLSLPAVDRSMFWVYLERLSRLRDGVKFGGAVERLRGFRT